MIDQPPSYTMFLDYRARQYGKRFRAAQFFADDQLLRNGSVPAEELLQEPQPLSQVETWAHELQAFIRRTPLSKLERSRAYRQVMSVPSLRQRTVIGVDWARKEQPDWTSVQNPLINNFTVSRRTTAYDEAHSRFVDGLQDYQVHGDISLFRQRGNRSEVIVSQPAQVVVTPDPVDPKNKMRESIGSLEKVQLSIRNWGDAELELQTQIGLNFPVWKGNEEESEHFVVLRVKRKRTLTHSSPPSTRKFELKDITVKLEEFREVVRLPDFSELSTAIMLND